MVEQGKGGSIVHVSSVASKIVPVSGGSGYAPTKGAVDSLAQAMALELGPHKVCLSVSPYNHRSFSLSSFAFVLRTSLKSTESTIPTTSLLLNTPAAQAEENQHCRICKSLYEINHVLPIAKYCQPNGGTGLF